MWPNQMFVSDIAHLVTLLAGIGQTSVRVSVHGLASNLLHSLYVAHGEGPVGANIRNLLEEVNSQEKLHLFGLAKMSISSEYSCHDPQTEQEAVDTVEELSFFMQKVIATCSGSVGLSNIWQARWMSLLIANAFQLSPSIQPRASILLGTLATRDMDDDLLYQMLVSLSNNLRASNEKNETETGLRLNATSTCTSLSDVVGPDEWRRNFGFGRHAADRCRQDHLPQTIAQRLDSTRFAAD